jgi:Ion channel
VIEAQKFKKTKPLGAVMDGYLWLRPYTSLRSILVGVDPSKTPNYLRNPKRQWLNRSLVVDLYSCVWPAIDFALLWLVTERESGHPISAMIIGIVATYRLNEIFGGILWVLLRRARDDYADARKLAMTLLLYFEPILLFAILHGSCFILLNGCDPLAHSAGYSLDQRGWDWITALHYSVGRYTTVGAEGILPISTSAMILSDIETLVGIIMIALTISVFVSRALPSQAASDSRESGR